MKRLLCYLVILFISTQLVYAQNPPPVDIDIWRIDGQVEDEMKERVNECGLFKRCKGEGIIKDSNLVVYHQILEKFPETNYTITWLLRRYRNKDEDRYREKRKISDRKIYDVGGYLTWIVKVEKKPLLSSTTKLLAETYYYDIATIKPPPEED